MGQKKKTLIYKIFKFQIKLFFHYQTKEKLDKFTI